MAPTLRGARRITPVVRNAKTPMSRLGLPPKVPETVTTTRFPSPGFATLPTEILWDAWELELLRMLKPHFPNIYLNAREKGGRLYLRFHERMPDGVEARHDLARYLEAARAYWLFLHEAGPKPPWLGPPVSCEDNPLDVRPSNRHTLLSNAPGTDQKRRVSIVTMTSVRIRCDAVWAGKDPDAEWARLTAEAKQAGAKPLKTKTRPIKDDPIGKDRG